MDKLVRYISALLIHVICALLAARVNHTPYTCGARVAIIISDRVPAARPQAYLVSEYLDRTAVEGGVVCKDSATAGLADLSSTRQAVPHHVETQFGK